MRGFVVLTVAGVIVAPTASAATAATPVCIERCETANSISTYDEGFGVGGHVFTPGDEGTPVRGSGSVTGPLVEYDYHPVCDGDCHSPSALATAASAHCTGAAVATWVAMRPATAGSAWKLQGPPECLSPAQQLRFDPAQLQATVNDYFQQIPLPAPGLVVAPDDNAVVNLPEIVSANPPGATTFTVDVAPFPAVTVSATISWEWSFGDGTSMTTQTPGRSFQPGETDLSKYLTHTYRSASSGLPLTVTSVWSATYTVAGFPAVEAVNGTVRRTTTRMLAVAGYGSALTGN